MAIAWKIKTEMTFLFACMLLWNHIRFIFTAKNFGRCDLSIYRLVTQLIRRKYFAERVLHKNKSLMHANKSGSKDYQQQEKNR